MVTCRGLDPGDLVGQSTIGKDKGTPLVVVQQIDKLRVVSYLPERDAVHLDLGDPVEITLDSSPGKVIAGTIAHHAKSLDAQTRLMRVEVDLPNDGTILPGLYGRMNVLLEKRAQALVVAPDCIRSSAEGPYVFVVGSGGSVEKRAVTTGIDDGHRIEILKGLDGSEKVVGGMIGSLKDGEAVTVISN